MLNLRKFVVIVSLCSGLLQLYSVSFAASPSVTPTFTFAVIPFYGPDKIWTLYSPFVAYLNKTTGQSWELKLYSNHEEVIEGLCNGQISVALLGPVPLGRTYAKCGVKPLVVALDDGGKPFYHSVLLTNDKSVTTLAGLKGKKVGFFKGSTAAHIIPEKILKDAGLGMTAINPVFLESQERVMSSLLSGEIAAAGVKETMAKKFAITGLRTVAVSQPLPNFSLCAAAAFPVKARQRLVAALLRLKPATNAHDAKLMKNWDDEINNGFMLPGKDFISSVEKIQEIYKEMQHENR